MNDESSSRDNFSRPPEITNTETNVRSSIIRTYVFIVAWLPFWWLMSFWIPSQSESIRELRRGGELPVIAEWIVRVTPTASFWAAVLMLGFSASLFAMGWHLRVSVSDAGIARYRKWTTWGTALGVIAAATVYAVMFSVLS